MRQIIPVWSNSAGTEPHGFARLAGQPADIKDITMNMVAKYMKGEAAACVWQSTAARI